MSFLKPLTVFSITVALAISGAKADSRTIILNGNSNGVWSPSHPEMMRGSPPEHSMAQEKSAIHKLPTRVSATEQQTDNTPTICPTLNSAPHLCANF